MSALPAEEPIAPEPTPGDQALTLPELTSLEYQKSPYSQAVTLQRIIIHRALNPKLASTALAQLARAWDVLEERKRILRGKPLPGHYRPDLHPDQVMRAAKRARARMPLDITSSHEATFKEQPTQPTTPAPPPKVD